jgi:endonuclease IV
MDCCCTPRKLTLKVRRGETRCGVTLPFMGTLLDTVSAMPPDCCKTIQTMVDDEDGFIANISADDKRRTIEYCTRNNTSLYIHCPMRTNLAKPVAHIDTDVVKRELDIVAGMPAACVLHIGKVGTIENVAQRINDMQRLGHLPLSPYSTVPYHLLLEIAAGQGSELGRTWEEIRHLYEALDYTRVGLCVDTQHAYASGMCEFQTHEQVVKLFDSAQHIMSKGISMLHINDSAKPFNSHVDRHAPLTKGYIWNRSQEGLLSLIRLCKDFELDMVPETTDPVNDISVMKFYSELK